MSLHPSDEKATSIPQSSPASAPEFYAPYLQLIRFEKPTGTMLMFWPFAWGFTMAAYAAGLSLDAYCTGLTMCFVNAFIIRSSACTVNDIFDREVDAVVHCLLSYASTAYSASRPLPSGRISVQAATLYLMLQYALGIISMYLTERGLALWIGLFQLIPLFAIYPLLKRVTYWPQAWLGFAMNFGFVTAWVSVAGTDNYPVLFAAMAGCWCWTMLYDTIYACQDIRDDIKVGVRSTAILFGSWIRPLLLLIGIAFVSLLAVAGALNGQGIAFFTVSIGGTIIHLAWQFHTVDLDIPESCWTNFKRNGKLGWIIWGGLMLDYLSIHSPQLEW
ncbi:4-hydroxybenzoate polyprenyltransferase, mitochondrial [Mycena sanguinolenta]|uniref:4-hydroxybenzoate polyprenyltransferase, mitochondrial n=1 Tax=Mycena sanguinolenta TaxID=230812 RepID=A0A8H7DD95_9AGAR|nr:4-hydroxybenzoate polyprenyltransferase, mitochondrial [Mycena sanguinolenta]